MNAVRSALLFAGLCVASLLFACTGDAPSRVFGPDGRPIGANIVSNPHAVKLPISIGQVPTLYYGATCADSLVDTRWCGRSRATAYDANGRVIADALGTWASSDPALAAVDSIGWITVHMPAGDTVQHAIPITFTLR